MLMTLLTARGESLGKLLESVERNNLTLREMREEMKAQGYEIKEENRLDNTGVEYSPFYRKGAEGIASSELIVTQEFDFPTLYAVRGKAGKSRVNVLEKQYALAARDLMLEAAENYVGLVRVEKVRAHLEEQLANAEKLATAYAKKADEGDATSIDVNRISIQVMQIRKDLLACDGEKAAIEAAIKALNGYESFDSAGAEYPDWAGNTMSVADPGNDAEVALAASEVESSRMEESVAKQQWLPKLTLGYRRNTEMEEASHGFVVGASFPFFTAGNKMKAARARRAAAEVAMDNARHKVAGEVEAALREIEIARSSLLLYDAPLLDETRRLLAKSLELGQITITDYYSELATINERKLDYIELEYEYYRKMCVLYKNQLK